MIDIETHEKATRQQKFSKMPYELIGLELAISQELDRLANELGFSLIETNIKEKFTELIKKMPSG